MKGSGKQGEAYIIVASMILWEMIRMWKRGAIVVLDLGLEVCRDER